MVWAQAPPPRSGASWAKRGRSSVTSSAKISAFDGLAEPAGEILDELPGDAARTRAAGHLPLDCLAPQLFGLDRQFEGLGIAFDDREESVLIAIVKTDPEA